VTVRVGADIPLFCISDLAEASRQQLEADCFWCFSKLLDGIQDNYTFAQPGIQLRISSLKELISRIDGEFFLSRITCASVSFHLRRVGYAIDSVMFVFPFKCWETGSASGLYKAGCCFD